MYRFIWMDGHLQIIPSNAKLDFAELISKGIDEFGLVPNGYVGGFLTDAGEVNEVFRQGIAPSKQQIQYLVFDEMARFGREQSYRERVKALAATVEDTEPANNFGFLTQPHESLYPAAFENEKMRPEALKAIKAHVLNAIEEEISNPDNFIYFTVYGSGASYNWDETGDFDVQMWVDYQKFIEVNDKPEYTQDDLLADVRRLVQAVNFPTFAELNLQTDDCDGAMLIQFYAKPGTGSPEENLASKPYACYDMETDEWLQKPEPITPEFYGEAFLLVLPKAEDVALQAEGLLSELNRDIVNWQFWRGMYDIDNDPEYKRQFDEAQSRAEQHKEGVANLFDNIFKGRQEAYSEKGEGYKDERDFLQKLLEVWGIFQQLKHFARAPLPWDEQEVPDKESAWYGDPFIDNIIDIIQMHLNDRWDVEQAIRQTAIILSQQLRQPFEQLYETVRGVFDQYIKPLLTSPEEDEVYASNKEKGGNDNSNLAHTIKTGEWVDVQDKAKRYLDEGRVDLQVNAQDRAIAVVHGDNGDYQTEIYRNDPQSNAITMWSCTCPWGEHSWGRTRQWKRYEGRPCAHATVLHWVSQTQPLDGYDQDYGDVAEPAAPIDPTQQQQPMAEPAPADSHLKDIRELGPLEMPGTFSKVVVSFFENGEKVRAHEPMQGFDDRGEAYIVPENMAGEVLWSDEDETIVIFPINSGPLEAHLVKVVGETTDFYLDPKAQPFVKRKSDVIQSE